ncbi:hypothetical protein [Streptomyces sp. NPDC054765]
MVVPVAMVSRVAVAVVHLVDVTAMRHRYMPAAFPMRMVMTGMLLVPARLALVRRLFLAGSLAQRCGTASGRTRSRRCRTVSS